MVNSPKAPAPLTDTFVKNLRPSDARQEFPDPHTPGLRMRVSPTGKKSWIYEKRVKAGTKRKHMLGVYPDTTLKQARASALAIKVEADRGFDRVEEQARELERKQVEIAEQIPLRRALTLYHDLHAKNLRTGNEVMGYLWKSLDGHLDRPATSITQPVLQKAIDDCARRAPVQANRLRAHLSHFSKFCRARGHFAQGVGLELSKPTKESSRDVELSVENIRTIFTASFGLGDLWGPLVRLMLLTAQRENEIAGLIWPEVLLDRRVLNLGGTRTKNGVGHITHLSDPALEELNWLSAGRDEEIQFVFTTTNVRPVSGFSKMKTKLDTVINGRVQPWRLHDIRTAFATTMADLGEDEGVVDRILNHQATSSAPSVVSRVYNRAKKLPQRQKVLDRWGRIVVGVETFALSAMDAI